MTQNELKTLRKKIDKIDDKIRQNLSERFSLTQQVKKYKKKEQTPVQDPSREAEILKKCQNPEQEKIFQSILAESRKKQA